MAQPPPLIVSVSGIRGIVGASLNSEIISGYAAAFVAFLPASARIVLARDTRPSGKPLAAVVVATLIQSGCKVLDLGICPTPTAKLMVDELGADGAIIITASHNPQAWNGLKLAHKDGVFLNQREMKLIEKAYREQDFRIASGGNIESVATQFSREAHLTRLLQAVDVSTIQAAGLKIAVDTCNGTATFLFPELLCRLGVETIFIHNKPTGRFAHAPEPLPENLTDLGRCVRENRCALGLAIDPDADRVALVDDRGVPIGEDCTLALAVQAVANRKYGAVVTTLSTSQIVTDVALQNGFSVELTPVGEIHVVEKMLQIGAVLGGEGNGGVVLTEVCAGRDAAAGTALALEAVARSASSLTEILGGMPRYTIEKRKVDSAPRQLESAVTILRSAWPEALVHPVTDGVKLYLSGSMVCPWIHLRQSNTEPVVRIFAESANANHTRQLCDQAARALQMEQ